MVQPHYRVISLRILHSYCLAIFLREWGFTVGRGIFASGPRGDLPAARPQTWRSQVTKNLGGETIVAQKVDHSIERRSAQWNGYDRVFNDDLVAQHDCQERKCLNLGIKSEELDSSGRYTAFYAFQIRIRGRGPPFIEWCAKFVTNQCDNVSPLGWIYIVKGTVSVLNRIPDHAILRENWTTDIRC